MAGTTMARVPAAGSTVTGDPAFLRTSAYRLATIGRSSKLVEPMMMVGFEAAEATAEVLRVTSMVSATAPMRRRVKRMSGSFSSRGIGVVLLVPVLQLWQTLFRHTTVTTT